MKLTDVYELGRSIPIGISLESDQHKLSFIRFKYTSKEVTGTAFIILGGLFFLWYLFGMLFPAGSVISTIISYFLFLGLVAGIIVYVYPVHIYYSQELMNYNEQMLRSILSMTNFISMRTSFEYAFIETSKQIKGVLQLEFIEIVNKITRKSETSLGDAFEPYIPQWVSINPVFVKSLRLLQTALMAEDEDRDTILQETIRTLMINFKIQGKRSAEELAGKAKNLVAFGVLLPVTSLMLLPLLSIFMPHLARPATMIFMFNILFPIFILLLALDFANKRIQIDTIDLALSPGYKKLPWWLFLLCFVIISVCSVPGMNHLVTIDLSTPDTAEREYQFAGVFYVWLITFGIMFSIFIITKYYIHLHEKLWKDVKETEDDLPHLLQILSTYLSLNISMENIIPRINRDYKEEGFPDHPIVKIFTVVSRKLIGSKDSIQDFLGKILKELCPSIKVTNILNMIVSFSSISLESATKAAKLIREQTISIIELDDYMRTLLSETVGLINVTITMLMPLLSAVSVIMALVIVKSLTFISRVLADIGSSFGMGRDALKLDLVDVTQILPPTMLELIVGLYFIEMFLVLSLFATKIDIGNDMFRLAKTINSNLFGFVVFTIILLGGHFAMMEIFFKGMLGEGDDNGLLCGDCIDPPPPVDGFCPDGVIYAGKEDRCGCIGDWRCVAKKTPDPPTTEPTGNSTDS